MFQRLASRVLLPAGATTLQFRNIHKVAMPADVTPEIAKLLRMLVRVVDGVFTMLTMLCALPLDVSLAAQIMFHYTKTME